MFRYIVAAACTALIVTPAFAQSATGEIVVAGTANTEAPAQWARVGMSLRGEGKTSVDALRALTGSQKKVEGGLGRLLGAKSVDILTGDLKVTPVQAGDCDSDSYPPKAKLEQGECAIQGYVATLRLLAKITPGQRAGDAASLAAELGGRDVALADFGLENPQALRDAATKAAVEDARTQATAMARAAGRTLGPITKIQSGAGFVEPELEVATMDAAAAAKPLAMYEPAAPTVGVNVTVPPVTDSARVIVSFRLEP